MTHRTVLLAASCAVWLMPALPAFADAIDGDWCRADGQRMAIHGPAIVTPGGQKTQGDYGRHSFAYVVPAGEPGAGTAVSITLLSENLAQAREGGDAAVKEWKRCQPGIS